MKKNNKGTRAKKTASPVNRKGNKTGTKRIGVSRSPLTFCQRLAKGMALFNEGRVTREGNTYYITVNYRTNGRTDNLHTFTVRRQNPPRGPVMCTCADYENAIDLNYMCEHKCAVRAYLNHRDAMNKERMIREENYVG